MKTKNESLHKARKYKKDEFFTDISDIEIELEHYKEHFKDKVIYCNCDDHYVSNFFKFFFSNFKKLGLKKLIATCYKEQTVDLFSKDDIEKSLYAEYDGNKYKHRYLVGDGIFVARNVLIYWNKLIL